MQTRQVEKIVVGCWLAVLMIGGALLAENPPLPIVSSPPVEPAEIAEFGLHSFHERTHGVRPSTCSDGSTVAGMTSGPDLIVGHVFECEILGRVGPVGAGTVGMSCATTACTIGDMGTNWFGLPSIDHPLISVNLFRQWKRDGSDRLEQIGRGWIKHGFGTANADECGFGCTPGHFNLNGPGCSDTYVALQFDPCNLGPRSMVNPYTGVMPFSDSLGASGGCTSNFLSNNHSDHVHDDISHRVQVLETDLAGSLNVGARYVAEGQYIVPHEFVDGNGTQNNNVSHRHILRVGPDACGDSAFVELGATNAQSPAIDAWTGASQSLIEPQPLVDGRGFLLQQVTDLGGVWRYDYSLYNMNLDQAFGSLSIPLPAGVAVSNIGFKFPPNHAPEPNTENYNNIPWSVSTSGGAITWSTASFGTDPFANAVRWGSMYNFYFDANTPPIAASATVGLFKTSGTAMASTLGPSAGPVDCNNNTIEDRCDVDCGLPGCSVPGCGTATDCNANFVPDVCEPDCNSNSVADRCDIAASTSADCDADAVPDECEPFVDCDGNLVRDDCEAYTNPPLDANNDGLLDICGAVNPATWFVDDDGSSDPAPGDTSISDPVENGTLAHPFDAIQEAIVAAAPGDIVIVRDGVYRGQGNRDVFFLGKPITVRSENGPASTIIDLESADFTSFVRFSGEQRASRLAGFQVTNLSTGNNALAGVDARFTSGPTIENCWFITSGSGTKGIHLSLGAAAKVSRCLFVGVRNPIEIEGGLHDISDCLIYDCIAGVTTLLGPGTTGCIRSSQPRIVNSTITACGRALNANAGSFLIIENSLFWGHTVEPISAPVPGDVSVENSNIQGGWPGTGNINTDPLFVNAAADDYHLSDSSPCIDAGDNSLTLGDAADFEGGDRFFDRALTPDTGVGAPPIVDMGADEWSDCNKNGLDDYIDLLSATSADCNANRTPDECEVLADCNLNLVADACEIQNATGTDCNVNGVLDACDITAATSLDCTSNGTPDECETDCNANFVADSCDIQSATSLDANFNGVPDECEATPPPDIVWNSDPLYALRANRSITLSAVASVTATGGNGSSAIQVRMIDLQNPVPANPPCCPPQNFGAFESATCTAVGEIGGCDRWVGPIQSFFESTLNPGAGNFRGARLQCSPYYFDWTTEGDFSVFGAEIVPSSVYEIRAFGSSCKGIEGSCSSVSTPVNVLTRRWGDIAAAFQPPGGAAQPDALDITAMVNKFRSLPTALSKRNAGIKGNSADPNLDVDGIDIVSVVDAFRGLRFAFSGPCVCPSTFACGATACTADVHCPGGSCVKTCTGGVNNGLQCFINVICPGGTCGAGFCRDRCGRCSP